MPSPDIIRGDAALEAFLGLPRGALAKRRLQGRPVPPGVLLPQARIRLYIMEDLMAWIRAHQEPAGPGDPRPDTSRCVVTKSTGFADRSPPVPRRGRPPKAASRR